MRMIRRRLAADISRSVLARVQSPGPVRPGQLSADLNSARHRLGLFRNRDRQHAVTAGGVHLLAIDRIGQYKAPVKLAMTSLDPAPLGLVAPFAARLPAFA